MLDDAIWEAIIKTGVPASRVNTNEAQQLRRVVEGRWTDFSDTSLPLWERFRDSVGKRVTDGWQKACEFVGASETILFFDESATVAMWRVPSGQALSLILEECPAFEFYLTDMPTNYVLCENHHDYLIGVGSCTPWLESLQEF